MLIDGLPIRGSPDSPTALDVLRTAYCVLRTSDEGRPLWISIERKRRYAPTALGSGLWALGFGLLLFAHDVAWCGAPTGVAGRPRGWICNHLAGIFGEWLQCFQEVVTAKVLRNKQLIGL